MAINETADFLFQLRQANKRVNNLPDELKPQDITSAYAVQEKVVKKLLSWQGGKRIGYKIGCTSLGAQKLLSTDGPLFGQMLSHSYFEGSTDLMAAEYSMIVIEPEFGFQLAKDVPNGSYDAESIQPFIQSVMPSIEIVHHRLGSWDKFNAPITIADNAIHACWVRGEPINDWEQFDYPNHEVQLFVDDELTEQGRGELALGNPLNVMAWLANTLPEYGHTLKANDYVTTGVCMNVYEARVGQKIHADFGSLGSVSLTIK